MNESELLSKMELLQSKLAEMESRQSERLTKVESTLFGVNGQGGLYPLVVNIDKKQEESITFQNKLIGALFGINAALSIISILMKFFI